MNKLIDLTQTTDTILLIFSIVSTLAYFTYFLVKYKFIPSSISATTKYLERSEKHGDREWLFSLFITNISIPLALINGTWLGIVSGAYLWIIALFTGYNNWLKKVFEYLFNDEIADEFEDYIHVFCTMLSIAGIVILHLLNAITIKELRAVNIILPSVFIIFTFIFWKRKIKYHTTWIEIFALFGLGFLGLYLNDIMI